MRPPLRIGILVNSTMQPAWVRRVLEEIEGSSVAELSLVIRNAAHRTPGLARLALQYRRQLLPLLYDRIDARLVRAWRQPDAFASADLGNLTRSCAVIEVQPRQTRFSDYFPDEVVDEILKHELDVALRFGFRILRGRALSIARYGVWSYHHGDNLVNRGGPNSFWEVMQAQPVTGAVLQVLSEDLDNGRVLYRSWSATNPLSLSLNRNPHYWKASTFIMRKLRDLYERGPQAIEGEPGESEYRPYSYAINTRPTNLKAVPLLTRLGARQVGRLAEELVSQPRWQISYGLDRSSQQIATSFFRFRQLRPPGDRSWSEPFPIEREGRYFIFLTERLSATGGSRIGLARLDGEGVAGAPEVALETADQLSYPCSFEWRGEQYLLPTSERGEVLLYRCHDFPGCWEPQGVLLEQVRAAHATVTQIEGRWWMFVNLAVAGASLDDELHLYFADNPLGPWRPHPRNPVKSDVRSALPAGQVFRFNGQLYRPAQDRSSRLTSAIVINRIDELTPTTYREVETARIVPKWAPGLIATGTINHVGRLTCLDTAGRQIRLPRPARR